MATARPDAEQLAREYVKTINERDYSRLSDLVSESFVLHDPAADDELRGPDSLEEFMRGIVAGFPDFHVSIGDLLVGAETAMYEATMTMTHEGEFHEIPPTGEAVEVREMAKLAVEDGAIREHRVYFDRQEILEQLGLEEE